jgi:NADH-quinone oxidoreductase subunit M
MIGKILYGVNVNPEHAKIHDAHWEERLAIIVLIFCIAGIGLAPSWISHMIEGSVGPMMQHIGHFTSQCNPFL